MSRYVDNVYSPDARPRWLAVFGLQWQIIDCHRVEAAADLVGAMMEAIQRLARDGWHAEAEPRFGFVFIQRGDERRLLMLTPKDPYDKRLQSFNPFR